jgi:hypothetical protein
VAVEPGHAVRRLLLALTLLAVTAIAPLRAADSPKPKVRAITGFVTIDAKSYPKQLEEAVAFLNQVRNAVKAAGYDVARRRWDSLACGEAGGAGDQERRRAEPPRAGQLQLRRDRDVETVRPVLSGCVASRRLLAQLRHRTRVSECRDGVFAREHDPQTAGKVLTDALAVHDRAVKAAAMKAAAGRGWTYAGIDPTPAPGGDVFIGAAIESFIGAPFGSPGTETTAGIITRAVKDVPVKQTGYSGLMIPVLEETVLTRWTEGTYGLDSILAYSAVCAGGVDTVPLPGDTSEAAIARIIGDVATLAFKWNKPLAARLLPSPGKNAGETIEFSGALSNAIIQRLPGAGGRAGY